MVSRVFMPLPGSDDEPRDADHQTGTAESQTRERYYPRRVELAMPRHLFNRLLAAGSGFDERFRLSRELAGRVVAERLGAGSAQ